MRDHADFYCGAHQVHGSIIRSRFILLFLLALFSGTTGGTAQPAQTQQKDLFRAGAPLVEARRAAVLADDAAEAPDAELIGAWMKLASDHNLAEQRLFLEPFSPAEQRLIERVESRSPPIVHRTYLDSLPKILARGALIAPREAERRGMSLGTITTPPVEELLFGGRDCIFATVGPPNGTQRYGPVVMRFKPSVCETAWATPASGDNFLDNKRFKNTVRLNSLLRVKDPVPGQLPWLAGVDFDDRLHFSHRVVCGADLQAALALQAVMKLRSIDPVSAAIRSRLEALATEEDPRRFWALFCDDRPGVPIHQRAPLGYLEAKMPQSVPLEDVESIELTPEDFETVKAWPEAGRWRALLRLQQNVPQAASR